MAIKIKRLFKKPQVFLRLTGVSIQDFQMICAQTQPIWEDNVEKKKRIAGRPYGLGDLETHILCILIYYRTYITQEFLGFLFDVDDSCICRSIKRVSRVLAPAISIKKERGLSAEEAMDLIIDCTEQHIERPKCGQKKYYSGKKKKHTLKTELQITGKGKIVHISNPHPGRDHDMTIRAQGPPLPPNAQAYVDGGYQGLHKDHGNTEYPYKKSKNHPLTKEEKQYNRALASFRVRVEHKIRELKIFRFLKEQNRNRRKEYGIAVQIIAGIVNIKDGF